MAGPPPYSARSRPRECLVECRIVTALPLELAPVRHVGCDACVLTAEVTFTTPREGVRIQRVGVHELDDGSTLPVTESWQQDLLRR
ncbi:MAG: hypothetical protein JO281_20370 [Pseudonocardiales bacterium]|nr:hypothetical protein [Pseudonocardiales bacterium]